MKSPDKISPALSRKWLVEREGSWEGQPREATVMEFKKPMGYYMAHKTARKSPFNSGTGITVTPLPVDMKELPHNVGDK